MIRTDRGIIKYIMLSIITCGIYAIWYQYRIARDINIICEGDGKHTGGLLKFVFLGILTLGIYVWVWYFCTAKRLVTNAERYGVKLYGDGKTVLLWKLFGGLLFGIGWAVAEYIIMGNTNILAEAYNKQHYGMEQQDVIKWGKKIEGECKWYIFLVAALALVSTQIEFVKPLWEGSFFGETATLISEWENNRRMFVLECGSIGIFCSGVFFYVLSATMLLLGASREVGTCAILGYYCNLISTIAFLMFDGKLFEQISVFYLIVFAVLNIVAIVVLSKNNEAT